MKVFWYFLTDIILTVLYVCAGLFWFFPAKFIEYGTLAVLTVGLFLIAMLWILDIENYKKIRIRKVRKEGKAIFLDDREICDSKKDELGFREDAIRFAKDVLNGNSSNPIVFGLDAPWGSGKSSYLNICEKEVWEKQNDLIVFRFRPIIYSTKRQDLFVIFIEEFVKMLKPRIEQGKVDSLKLHLRRYSQIIQGFKINFFGLNVEFRNIFLQSSEKTLKQIEDDVKALGEKIIIVVDDLDRLYLEDVKAMLNIVRNILYIPNITFILCYDTDSINAFDTSHKTIHTYSDIDQKQTYSRAEHEMNNQKINAYFEKIVQVKKTLIPDREMLIKYFRKELKNICNKEDESLQKFLDGIAYFFLPENYPNYQELLGDVRKIKRIVNFLRASNLVNIDYDERDIDPIALLKLVLLYINYPHIFRKVYNSETSGSSGFFSLERNEDYSQNNGKLLYKNSDRFLNYLKTVKDSERFLLKDLFFLDSKQGAWEANKLKQEMDSIEFQRISPMFNGGMFMRKNLEDYLQIIVERKLLERWKYDNFHLNRVADLKTKSVDDIFVQTPEYSAANGEQPRDQFFMNAGTSDIDFESATKVLSYITENIAKYSLVNEFSEIYNGLRDDLVYEVIFLLNRRGWKDKDGGSYHNTAKNVALIAKRIFGEGDYRGNGIFDAFIDVERGILGISDASRFLSACDRRGSSDNWNLYTSLDNYGKEKGTSSKRILGQKLYAVFKSEYINKNINFLEKIEQLPEEELLGDFKDYIVKEFERKNASLTVEISKIKSSLAGHILYQFGRNNDAIGMLNGDGNEDGGGISEEMQKYLFDVCFNVEKNIDNCRYFVNHLLASFSWTHEIRGTEYRPLIAEFKKAFDNELLANYWMNNAEKIKTYCKALPQDTKVFTYNYTANYSDDLSVLFDELGKIGIVASNANVKEKI
ncbi:MAG: P-loop NTPase fold protein [Candidatus Moraniibacteriota bacterium]